MWCLPNKYKDLSKYYLGMIIMIKSECKILWLRDVNLLPPRLPHKVHISSTFLSPQYYKNEDLALKASNSPLVN